MKKAIKLTDEVYNLLETMGVKNTKHIMISSKEQFNTIRLGRSQLPPVPADL